MAWRDCIWQIVISEKTWLQIQNRNGSNLDVFLLFSNLMGQYHHDQQGMESEGEFEINSATENNTHMIRLLLHKWASNFQSLCSR